MGIKDVKNLINLSIEDNKIARFFTFCENVYTKEYLGTDLYGQDPAYDDQLTTIATAYEISIFYATCRASEFRQLMLDKMRERTPKHPSQFLFE